MEGLSSEENGLIADVEEPVMVRSRGRWHLPLTLLGVTAAIAVVTFSATSKAAAGASVVVPRGLLFGGASIPASISCYPYTGGSCSLQNCDVRRGGTCQDNKCVCEAACAGSDGKCHKGKTNTVVATDFTLTNVYWPRYSMFFEGVSAMGQLKTTNAYSWMNMGKDKFSFYRLPGPSNETRFLLGSVAYPSEAARVASTSGTAISGQGLDAIDLSDAVSLDKLAVSACYDKAKSAVMVGDKAGETWAYVHRGSWLVYGSSAQRCKVGERGLWTPFPAFTAEQISMLPACC